MVLISVSFMTVSETSMRSDGGERSLFPTEEAEIGWTAEKRRRTDPRFTLVRADKKSGEA
jgi:hypothetical protein